MTKIFIATIFAVLFVNSLFGQDLIVTSKGDSINCKITKERDDFIYFTFLVDQEIRETLLQKSDVKTFSKDYFSQSLIPSDYRSPGKNYEKIRISVNGGYSYRFAKISESVPSEYRDYMKKLKSGNHFSIDASYFLNESIGLGIKYSQFNSKEDFGTVNYDFDQDGRIDVGQMNDNMTISFIGPLVASYIPSANKKNALFSNIAIGLLSYKDVGTMIIPVVLKGSTLGLVGDVGYQIGIAKNLSVAFTLSYTLGMLSKVEQTVNGYTNTIELDDDNRENLGRIDFSVGLVFHK
ncbi:MAG: hypothetical protein Q8T04_11210 [Bacteroidota bacterium]|nr:hypothetical protein [Bacteroidota bacterium]